MQAEQRVSAASSGVRLGLQRLDDINLASELRRRALTPTQLRGTLRFVLRTGLEHAVLTCWPGRPGPRVEAVLPCAPHAPASSQARHALSPPSSSGAPRPPAPPRPRGPPRARPREEPTSTAALPAPVRSSASASSPQRAEHSRPSRSPTEMQRRSPNSAIPAAAPKRHLCRSAQRCSTTCPLNRAPCQTRCCWPTCAQRDVARPQAHQA